MATFPVSAGSLVKAEEYNDVAANINKIFGDKFSTAAVTDSNRKDTHKFGWGSSNIDDSLSINDPVVASKLQIMIDRTNVMIDHCNITDTILVFSAPTGREDILANTPIRAEDLNVIWDKIENTILPDEVRNSVDPTNASALNSGVELNRTIPWTNQLIGEWKWTFNDYNHARYFFNGGGQLRIAGDITGGTTAGYYNWDDVLQGMGILSFVWDNITQSDSDAPGLTESKGIYDLTEYYGDGSDAGTADEGLLFTSAGSGISGGYSNLQLKLYGKYANNGAEIHFKVIMDDSVFAHTVDGEITLTPSFLMPSLITRGTATFDVLPLPVCTITNDFNSPDDS